MGQVPKQTPSSAADPPPTRQVISITLASSLPHHPSGKCPDTRGTRVDTDDGVCGAQRITGAAPRRKEITMRQFIQTSCFVAVGLVSCAQSLAQENFDQAGASWNPTIYVDRWARGGVF